MTETRWWWIRHAPVVGHDGRIYGQDDPDCDCSDLVLFRSLAGLLPRDAVWVVTPLARSRRTAETILAHHAPNGTVAPLVEAALAEQHFGDWQGLTLAELGARRGGRLPRFWLAPAHEAPPGGESFLDVVERVSAAVGRLSADHAGRDIVAVAHGGTIRAALGLALGLEPERALAFTIDNCALTRIDHIAEPGGAALWRVRTVNLRPGIPG